jgi:hypothetical protein
MAGSSVSEVAVASAFSSAMSLLAVSPVPPPQETIPKNKRPPISAKNVLFIIVYGLRLRLQAKQALPANVSCFEILLNYLLKKINKHHFTYDI